MDYGCESEICQNMMNNEFIHFEQFSMEFNNEWISSLELAFAYLMFVFPCYCFELLKTALNSKQS